MIKKICYIFVCSLALSLQGCSSDSDSIDEPQAEGTGIYVSISTQIETKAVVKSLFDKGDAMNVWAKTYGKMDAPDLVGGIKAMYDGASWSLNPAVELQEGGKAFIYAVSPYSERNSTPAAIPVDVTEQVDVLYSGAYVPVTYTSNRAKLTMKHALALITFNISLQDYSGKGELQKVSITGANVYINGTMSVEKGQITGQAKGQIEQNYKRQIQTGGWNSDLPHLWSIPFSTQGSVATLTATVDGKELQADFPDIEMKKGYQYVFRMILTDYGLSFIPDQIETISLNQETDEMQSLENYGVIQITHAATDFTLPFLKGENVFGSVAWGDGQGSAYTFDGTHTYTGSNASWQLLIESWNSTGFELEDLTGVEIINVSQY